MENAQTPKIEGAPRKAAADEIATQASAVAQNGTAALELPLAAAAEGVNAPWVKAGLRSAGLTATQVASLYAPNGVTPANSNATPNGGTSTGAVPLVATPASSTQIPAVPAAPAAESATEAAAAEAPAPTAVTMVAPSRAAPAGSADLASLHEASAGVAQKALTAMNASAAHIEASAKRLIAEVHAHYATVGKQLDTHHDAARVRVQSEFAAQKTALTTAAATAHQAIVDGEKTARARMVEQEVSARTKATAIFDALPAAYTKHGADAKKLADGELADYTKLAQQKKSADTEKPTLLAGDMAQKRLDARLDAGKSLHKESTGKIDSETTQRLASLKDPKDRTRNHVLGTGTDGGLVGKTLDSLRGAGGQGGELGDMGKQLSASVGTQLTQLTAQLEKAELASLASIDNARKHGKTQLASAQKASVSALTDASHKNQVALAAQVQSSLQGSQESLAQSATQSQTTLGAIDKLLAQPTVARGPAAARLRALRGKLVASSQTASQGLAGHAAQLGAQVEQGGAQIASSLEDLAKHARAQCDQMVASQTKAIDASATQALAQFKKHATDAAQSLGSVTTHASSTFDQFIAHVPQQLDDLNGEIRGALHGQAEAFGTSLLSEVRVGDKRPLYQSMVSEGEKAAAAVQPRWKTVAKWALTIAVVLVVAVAAFFLAPLLIGLFVGSLGAVAATLVGGAIFGTAAGAIAGTAIQMGNNAVDMQGQAAPKDASGQPLTLTSGVMGWKGAMFTGAWTGALGGLVGGGVGQALAKLPIWAFIADQVVNVGIDAMSQEVTNGGYSLEGGAQNLAMSAIMALAMVHVGRRAAIRTEARARGVEPSTSSGGTGLVDRFADFTARLGEKGHAVGESLAAKLRGKGTGAEPAPAAQHAPVEEAQPAPVEEPSHAPTEVAHESLEKAPVAPEAEAATSPAATPVVEAKPTPKEVVSAMVAEKKQRLAGIEGRDTSWRALIKDDDTFVRVINRSELEMLVRDGKVTNPRTQKVIKNPMPVGDSSGEHENLLNAVYEKNEDGHLSIRKELGTTSAGHAAPLLPISALAPADSGYAESLFKSPDRFLVKFKNEGLRKGTGNDSVGETEFLIPMWYKLENVDWIASVHDDAWLYGAPGRAGADSEIAALKAQIPDRTPAAAASDGGVGRAAKVRARATDLRAQLRLLKRQMNVLSGKQYTALRKEMLSEMADLKFFKVDSELYRGDLDSAEEKLTQREAQLEAIRAKLPSAAHTPEAVAVEPATPHSPAEATTAPELAPKPSPVAEAAATAVHPEPTAELPQRLFKPTGEVTKIGKDVFVQDGLFYGDQPGQLVVPMEHGGSALNRWAYDQLQQRGLEIAFEGHYGGGYMPGQSRILISKDAIEAGAPGLTEAHELDHFQQTANLASGKDSPFFGQAQATGEGKLTSKSDPYLDTYAHFISFDELVTHAGDVGRALEELRTIPPERFNVLHDDLMGAARKGLAMAEQQVTLMHDAVGALNDNPAQATFSVQPYERTVNGQVVRRDIVMASLKYGEIEIDVPMPREDLVGHARAAGAADHEALVAALRDHFTQLETTSRGLIPNFEAALKSGGKISGRPTREQEQELGAVAARLRRRTIDIDDNPLTAGKPVDETFERWQRFIDENPNAHGDLGATELAEIQSKVDAFGGDLYVTGDAAKGTRRVRAGKDTSGAIRYASSNAMNEAADALALPGAVDGVDGVDFISLDNGPAIRFRAGRDPQFFTKGEGALALSEAGAARITKRELGFREPFVKASGPAPAVQPEPVASSEPAKQADTAKEAAPAPKAQDGAVRQSSGDIDKLYEAAAAAQVELSAATQEIANDVGGRAVIPSTLKSRERTIQKAEGEYGGDVSRVVDIARTTIVCKTETDVYKALEELRERFTVLRVKDRIVAPMANGYRDVLLNLDINGHVVETQLHLEAIIDVKNKYQHAMYEESRNITGEAARANRPLTAEETARVEQLRAASQALYDDAYATTRGDSATADTSNAAEPVAREQASSLQGHRLEQQLAAETAAGARAPLQIASYSDHALQQMAGRDGGIGVNKAAVEDAFANPQSIEYSPSKYGPVFRYTGDSAVVIINEQGNVVTAYATNRAGTAQ